MRRTSHRGAVSCTGTGTVAAPTRTMASATQSTTGSRLRAARNRSALRRNVRDDEHGIPYIVLGGGGARIKRSAVYPDLNKVPAGVLISAFDDKWFNTSFQFSPEQVQFTVHEAYSDSVLFETSWPLVSNTGAGDGWSRIESEASMQISPNPVHGNSVQLEIRFPGSGFLSVDRLTIADVTAGIVRLTLGRMSMAG